MTLPDLPDACPERLVTLHWRGTTFRLRVQTEEGVRAFRDGLVRRLGRRTLRPQDLVLGLWERIVAWWDDLAPCCGRRLEWELGAARRAFELVGTEGRKAVMAAAFGVQPGQPPPPWVRNLGETP
jgi:hypothetical protein